jgi:hypothetical protein
MAGHGRRKKQADDEPVVKEAEDPAVRAERKQTLVPQGGAYVADLLQKVWRMEEARLAGKAVPRLQLAGASERETDLQAPDTPTWLASGYTELVPVEPPKPPPVPAEVQYFRQWVLDKFTTFAEGWAQLDPKGVGSLTAGEFRDGVAGKWQYCDPRQATKLFFLHSLSTEARMTRVDFGFSDQQWQDYLVLAQQRRDREAQQKAEGRAGGTGLPGEPKVREPRPPPEPLVPEGEQSTAAGVLHDAQRAEGIPGMQSPRSAASRPATPAEMLVQEELPLDEDPELAGALDDWVDPDTVPQEDSEDERPATTESQKKAKEEAAEWGEEEGEEEDIFPQDEEPPAQEEDDDDAAKRAEEMGVLKAIDSSVKLVQRTEQEITGEVSEKINRVIPSSFEDVAGQRVSPRPPSSVGHPSEAEPDPYAEERLLSKQGTPEAEGKPAAASERMAATPEMSVKSQHEVVGAVVKTEEGVVLPKIDAEKVRNVTGKDPLEKKMQKKAPKITKDHSAGSELVRKMMRAPGGLQANAARMSDQMRQLLLEEMRQERLMKLKDIQEKEARRETQKKEAEAADKAAIEEIKKAKMAAADIDTELADAQRSEMAAWRRKKAMESEKKRVAEKALLEKAQAEQKEKARLKAEKEAQWKEEKQRRLRSHRKRVEAQAQAVSSGKGGAELPVITRHVHHHVHSHSVDSEDPSATIVNGEPLMAGESIETARGGVWAYPSERTGLYPSEGEPSVGPYASERYFRSIEEDGYDSGKETTRLAAKHKLSASASLPVLDPPSEMRRGGPTVANKLASGRYGASVNKASATYANAGRIRGAIR